ncbi:MAG: ABC transporter permease [Anaerolineae bacterium]|nr:ABC transporter permease [Anaerolineae bacterium]
MKHLWIVARREYLTNLRRPSFLFAAFGVPLFMVGLMFLVTTLISNAEGDLDSLGNIGYVDRAGVIAAADAPFVPYADEAGAQQALQDGTIGAYFVLPADYVDSGEVTITSREGAPDSLKEAIDHLLLANLTPQAGDDALASRLEDPVTLTVRALDRGRDLEEDAAIGVIMLPVVFAVVFFISAQTTSSYLMSSVVEEKTNRMIEILITSVTPLELLFGKIVGLGVLGLTQLSIWLIAGALLLQSGQGVPALSGIELPLDLIVISLVYFLLAYLLFAAVMAGIGAVSNSEQESRQLAGVFTFVSVFPFFFFTTFLLNPNSPISVALTLFPLTAPLTSIIRLSLGALPVWQFVASLLLLGLTAALVIWMSARVFRWSLLLYGKRPTPRELWRVIRGTPMTAVGTAAQE